MNLLKLAGIILGCLGVLSASTIAASASELRYLRVGNPTDATAVTPSAGFALMGGGDDLDEAFRWLCDRAGGGDFLVLRATNNDEYNAYVQKLCHVNSVATLVIPNRGAATDPEAAKIIARAGALFISGGDQANYINFWMGTPVQAALNDAIRRGVPLGGTSAGLAVMGEWAYSAQGDKPDDPNLDSKTAWAHPFGPRITLVPRFLDIAILKGAITDTHFAKRDRMGRLLLFLARLEEPDGVPVPPTAPHYRGIGVEQRAAILLEPDGHARVIGQGCAYFVDSGKATGVMAGGKFGVMALNKPLTFGPFAVQKVAPGHSFNLDTWTGEGVAYTLSVSKGKLRSTQAGGAIY